EDPLGSVFLQSDRSFMGQYKKTKENEMYLPELAESSLNGFMRNTVPNPTAVKVLPDEKEVSEEMEL
ncbi:hypothetical protein N307_04160, partial [Dryobates pubescens]